MARHTFATTVTLTNGVPLESVAKMLGHKSIKSTQHYAKVLDKKVSDDMKVLKDKFTLENGYAIKLRNLAPYESGSGFGGAPYLSSGSGGCILFKNQGAGAGMPGWIAGVLN